MFVWQEDSLQALHEAKTEGEFVTALIASARRLGFDYAAFGLRLPYPLSRPKTIVISNYPEQWKLKYLEQNYLEIDPTVAHGMRSIVPIVWSAAHEEKQEFWEDARSFGLVNGWSQSCRDHGGNVGMLTLSRAEGGGLSAVELCAIGSKMVWLAQAAHVTLASLESYRVIGPPKSLSSREVSVLRWCGEGKTSSEIAEILRISERTVNFHINRAMQELNAANRTSAVVQAAILGLL